MSEGEAVSRAGSAIKRSHGKFLLKQLMFTQQFSHMYFGRLNRLAPRCLEEAAKVLGAEEVKALGQSRVLQAQPGKRALVVGTLYKNLTCVTSFLREYTKELVKLQEGGGDDEDEGDGDGEEVAIEDEAAPDEAQLASGSAGALVSDNDTLVIEDDSGRVEVIGLPTPQLVTGVVVALVGVLEEKGRFRVEKVVYPSCKLPAPRSMPELEPSYVAIVAGLGVTASGECSSALSLLLDFLAGDVADPRAVKQAARISRVIVGGNLVEATDDARLKHKIRLEPQDHAKPDYSNTTLSTSANAMRRADELLVQLAATVDVDVMPGDLDPTNCFLPQQPLHPMMLPQAARKSTLKLVTNPFEATVAPINGGKARHAVSMVVSAGQIVDDITSQSQLDPTAALAGMLEWGQLAPTAPNTLACYPFRDMDPFVLDAAPNLLVSCNHDTFAHRLVKHANGGCTRLAAVPAFAKTGQLVLVNINSPTLDVELVSFA